MSDAQIRERLELAFGRAVVVLERKPGTYRSSHALEEVDVTFADGDRLGFVVKDLAASALCAAARRAKAGAPLDPGRELAAYRDVLGPAGLDVPASYPPVAQDVGEDAGRRCAGSTIEDWLLLERIAGTPLWQHGEPAVWEAAARWLAGLHAHGAPDARGRLVAYDPEYVRGLMSAAHAGPHASALDPLTDGWERVVDRLAGWPRSLVHGEFYPANVLVETTPDGWRVRPIDWELTGVGPGLLDLAALCSGGWSEDERRQLALAYLHALPAARRPQADELLDVLAYARLAVAVGWLAAPASWSPPAEHRHDWLGDALALARALELS